jgi:hypothetical protein
VTKHISMADREGVDYFFPPDPLHTIESLQKHSHTVVFALLTWA